MDSLTTPSHVASDRATLVSTDYVQSRQSMLNMDICICARVLPHLLHGTLHQRAFSQLRHLLLLKSHYRHIFKKIFMLIVDMYHIPSTSSLLNDITNTCLLFFVDHSVMVSYDVINMERLYIMFYVAELSAFEHLFEIGVISIWYLIIIIYFLEI